MFSIGQHKYTKINHALQRFNYWQGRIKVVIRHDDCVMFSSYSMNGFLKKLAPKLFIHPVYYRSGLGKSCKDDSKLQGQEGVPQGHFRCAECLKVNQDHYRQSAEDARPDVCFACSVSKRKKSHEPPRVLSLFHCSGCYTTVNTSMRSLENTQFCMRCVPDGRFQCQYCLQLVADAHESQVVQGACVFCALKRAGKYKGAQ